MPLPPLPPPAGLPDPVSSWLLGLPGLALLLVVVPVIVVAWCLASALGRRSRLDFALTLALLAMTLVHVLVVALASAHVFRLSVVVGVEVLLAAAALLGRRLWRGGGEVPGAAAAWPRLSALEVVLLAGLLLLGAVHVSGVLLVPPGQWDSLGYHLPIPAHWVTSGTFAVPRTSSFSHFYPFNHEEWLAWLMLPTHSDLVARFLGLAELSVLFLAVMGLAREAGAGRASAAALAAAGSLGLLAEAVGTTGNDVAMTATFALTLYYLLALRHTPTLTRGGLAVLSLGLFVGVKYPSLIYELALLAAAAVVGASLVRRYRPFATERQRLRGLLVALLLLVTLTVGGGFTYLRNVILTGNPVFPYTLGIGPVTFLQGVYQRGEDKTPHELQDPGLYSYRSIFFSPVYFHALGPQLYFPLALCALAAPVLLLLRRSRDPVEILLALLPLLTFALFKYGLPRQPPRFMGPVTVTAALTAAWVLMRVPGGRRLTPWIGVALVGYYLANLRPFPLPPLTAQWGRAALLPCLLPVLVGLAGLVLAGRVRLPARRAALVALALLPSLYGLNSGLRLAEPLYAQHRYEQWRPYLDGDLGKGWEWLAKETEGRPATVAFSGNMVPPYPLANTRLSNTVLYVPRGPETSAGLYDLGLPYGSPDREPDYSLWLGNLRHWRATYLYVGVLYNEQRWSYEAHWADEHPDVFELAFESDRTRLYRIRPE